MKPDHERVRSLLMETVTLLCRNGLHYDKELKIEGLLGITLDDKDVFIVHINEKVTDEFNTKEDVGNTSDHPANSTTGSLHQSCRVSKELRQMRNSVFSEAQCRNNAHIRRDKDSSSGDTDSCVILVKNEHSVRQDGLEMSQTSSANTEEDRNAYRINSCRPNLSQSSEFAGIDLDNLQTGSSDDFGLNLSVKDQSRNANKYVKLDAVSRDENDNTARSVDMIPVTRSQDVVDVKRESDSMQSWFAGECNDFPLNDGNNFHKGIFTDDCELVSSIPQTVAKVPLVRELIGSVRLRRLNSSASRRTSKKFVENSGLLVSGGLAFHGAQQSVLPRSQEHTSVESDSVGALYSSGSGRRPKCSRHKSFVCQVGGCYRMFFRGSELYRHQREKHGAQHVRPRATSLTSA